MFAEYLVIDERNDKQVWLPLDSLDDVKMAVQRLDGESHTLLVIGKDGCNLGISGGNHGLYRVCFDNQGQILLTLIATDLSSHQKKKRVDLNEGGVGTSAPRDECVDLDTAMAAACWFADTGEPSPQHRWVPSDRRSG